MKKDERELDQNKSTELSSKQDTSNALSQPVIGGEYPRENAGIS